MQYCAHQARLAAPDKNGVAQRAHLEGILERGVSALGRKKYDAIAAELDGPEFPEALGYLWDRFTVLNGMRHEGLHGPAPFTPESIAAANGLFRWQLTPLEVDGLRLLDGVWRAPEAYLKHRRSLDGGDA